MCLQKVNTWNQGWSKTELTPWLSLLLIRQSGSTGCGQKCCKALWWVGAVSWEENKKIFCTPSHPPSSGCIEILHLWDISRGRLCQTRKISCNSWLPPPKKNSHTETQNDEFVCPGDRWHAEPEQVFWVHLCPWSLQAPLQSQHVGQVPDMALSERSSFDQGSFLQERSDCKMFQNPKHHGVWVDGELIFCRVWVGLMSAMRGMCWDFAKNNTPHLCQQQCDLSKSQ